jgi:hypothetical protein
VEAAAEQPQGRVPAVAFRNWLPWNWFRRRRLDREALIQAATEYAQDQGYRMADYQVTAARESGGRFWVFFMGKSKLPGDHFSVLVDIETGRGVQLLPGA